MFVRTGPPCGLLFMLQLIFLCALNFVAKSFPLSIDLKGAVRPSGIVAGRGTNLYVSTVAGQIFNVNIKTGEVTMLNRGGDGQTLAGLCMDERNDGTLYAAGRETGRLYAFNRNGVLQRVYQITARSSKKSPHFIADCISSRRKLLITDAYSDSYYYLKLPDVGTEVGRPPPLAPFAYQGYKVPMRGAFKRVRRKFNAFGLEWTAKWNETAYMMNSASGQLFAFNLTATDRTGAKMIPVKIEGRQSLFPGALGILFDSTNELIMYIALPRSNSIAVLEFDYRNRYRAKYIRRLTSQLMERPIMMGEYGNFIYPISGHFGLSRSQREKVVTSISQVPRHRQLLTNKTKDADPFTTDYDNIDDVPEETPMAQEEIESKIKYPPRKSGVASAKPAMDRKQPGTAKKEPPPSESGDQPKPVFQDAAQFETKEASCFPASAEVDLENGSKVTMDKLRIGDRVLVGHDASMRPVFSDVYMFTHQDEKITTTFVKATMSTGQVIKLSPGHYMYLNGKLVAAQSAAVGDRVGNGLWVPSELPTIIAVSLEQGVGLYNPQTLDGNIVVNGVFVSTYTRAVKPPVAVTILSPLRAAHKCGLQWIQRGFSFLLRHGSTASAKWLPSGPSMYL